MYHLLYTRLSPVPTLIGTCRERTKSCVSLERCLKCPCSLSHCSTTCFAMRAKRVKLNLAEAARSNGKLQIYVRYIDDSESGLFLVLCLFMEVYL